MNTLKTTLAIVYGPNKGMLFDSLKYACGDRSNIEVYFCISPGATSPLKNNRQAYITAISLEDGSGNSFNVEGVLLESTGNRKFKAYYNTNTRKGTITQLDKPIKFSSNR